MSDSVRPHRRQLTGLHRPWDSPGKNTGVGYHFLQCRKVKSESEVAQLYLTFSNSMDGSLPGSSAHGICQARVLEWGAIAFSIIILLIYKDNKIGKKKKKRSGSVASDSLRPHKSAGVDCHFLLQGIFPTQELNPGLPLYRLSHQGTVERGSW